MTTPHQTSHRVVEGDTMTEHASHIRRILRSAVRSNATVAMRYSDRDGNITERAATITNAAMSLKGDSYFRAFCHLRQDDRTFRYDRILAVKVIG